MSSPMFSIVMPVFNASLWLDQSVGSIMNQSISDWELICIDDGSTDNSLQILKSFAEQDERIRVFHKKNGGVSQARNFGLEYIRGLYTLFVDSDDYLEQDALEIIKRTINDTLCDFGSFRMRMVHAEDKLAKEEKTIICSYKKYNVCSEVLSKLSWCVWDKFFKTSILKKQKIKFNEKFNTCEDLHFWFRFLTFSKSVAFIDGILYNYRKHRNGLTKTFIEEWQKMPIDDIRENLNILEDLSRYCDKIENKDSRKACRTKLLYISVHFSLFSFHNIIRLKGKKRLLLLLSFKIPYIKLAKEVDLRDIVGVFLCFLSAIRRHFIKRFNRVFSKLNLVSN